MKSPSKYVQFISFLLIKYYYIPDMFRSKDDHLQEEINY